jgi:hypothetical protein
MSYANSICQKLQLSARAMLRAAVAAETLTLMPSDNINAGIETTDATALGVVCLCKRATAEEIFDGNWTADLTVRVTAAFADTTEDQFHAIMGEVFAHFMLSPADVATNLSNASEEFTAFAVYPRDQQWDLVDDGSGNGALWQGDLVVTVKCCGSVIA